MTSYADAAAQAGVRDAAADPLSHLVDDPSDSDHMIETWFNPVMSQALVMPGWLDDHELRTPRELEALDVGGLVRDATVISVNTGHPQGGNPISRDPRRGVVDETLRIHGFDNLHVCDASVFPTALTVNPQLTVMALAHYAARTHIG